MDRFLRAAPIGIVNSEDSNFVQLWTTLEEGKPATSWWFNYRFIHFDPVAADHVPRIGDWVQHVLTFEQEATNASFSNFTAYARINGTLIGKSATSIPVDRNGAALEFRPDQGTYLTVGVYPGAPDEIGTASGFNGAVDELAMWNRVLDEDEVEALGTGTADMVAPAGLVLYYDFEEGEGDLVENRGVAGHAYNLTLGRTVTGTHFRDMIDGTEGEFTAPVWTKTNPGLFADSGASSSMLDGFTAQNITVTGVEDKESTLSVGVNGAKRHPQGIRSTITVLEAPLKGELRQAEIEFDEESGSYDLSAGELITSYPAEVASRAGLLFYSPPSEAFGQAADSFPFRALDDNGRTSTEGKVTVDLVAVDDRPVALSQALSTEEDFPINITLRASDAEDQHLTVVVTSLPEHGTLLREDGTEITNAFSLWAFEEPVAQHAVGVAEVSSYWALADSFDYHPWKILGQQDVFNYGDAGNSWCPLLRKGDSDNGGEGYVSPDWVAEAIETGCASLECESFPAAGLEFGPHNPKGLFEQEFYTEFIVLDFEEPVYTYGIEIGENRGMGAIREILAMDSETGAYSTLWEDEVDKSIQAWYALVEEYRLFAPSQVCQHAFLTKRIRLNIDTRTVEDWNEIDFVKLTGAKKLQASVMANDAVLKYIPDKDYFGVDSFAFAAYDCPFHKQYQSEEATVSMNVTAVNDAPMLCESECRLSANTEVAVSGIAVDLAEFASDVEDDAANRDLVFQICELPTIGAIYDDDGVDGGSEVTTVPHTLTSGGSIVLKVSSVSEFVAAQSSSFVFCAVDSDGGTSSATFEVAVDEYLDELRIGFIVAIDPESSVGPRHVLSALKMAIDEINADKDLLPHTEIKFVMRNNRMEMDELGEPILGFPGSIDRAESAKDAATYFVTRAFGNQGVDAMIGPGWSGPSIAVATLMEDIVKVGLGLSSNAMIPHVGFSSTSTQLAVDLDQDSPSEHDRFPFFFRTVPSDSFQGVAMADLIASVFGWDHVLALGGSDAYGAAGIEQFNIEAQHRGIDNLISPANTYGGDTLTDGDLLVAELCQAKEEEDIFPRVIVIFAHYSSGGRILKRLYDECGFASASEEWTVLVSDSLNNYIDGVYKAFGETGDALDDASGEELLGSLIGFAPSSGFGTEPFASFADRFLAQESTSGDGANACHQGADNEGNSLWTDSYSTNASSTCVGIDFADLPIESINPFAPYAYDAVYLLATALDEFIAKNPGKKEIDRLGYLDKISMFDTSAVGDDGGVSLVTGDLQFDGRGDRTKGVRYDISVFALGDDKSIPAKTTVGQWALTDSCQVSVSGSSAWSHCLECPYHQDGVKCNAELLFPEFYRRSDHHDRTSTLFERQLDDWHIALTLAGFVAVLFVSWLVHKRKVLRQKVHHADEVRMRLDARNVEFDDARREADQEAFMECVDQACAWSSENLSAWCESKISLMVDATPVARRKISLIRDVFGGLSGLELINEVSAALEDGRASSLNSWLKSRTENTVPKLNTVRRAELRKALKDEGLEYYCFLNNWKRGAFGQQLEDGQISVSTTSLSNFKPWAWERHLGEGAFGSVHLVRQRGRVTMSRSQHFRASQDEEQVDDTSSAERRAVKFVTIAANETGGDSSESGRSVSGTGGAQFEALQEEIRLQLMAGGHNSLYVLTLYSFEHTATAMYIFMQFCPRDLKTALASGEAADDDERLARWSAQLCEGVRALHEKGIAHLDLKPENAMVEGWDVVKIAEFGCAYSFADGLLVPGMDATLLGGTTTDRPVKVVRCHSDGSYDLATAPADPPPLEKAAPQQELCQPELLRVPRSSLRVERVRHICAGTESHMAPEMLEIKSANEAAAADQNDNGNFEVGVPSDCTFSFVVSDRVVRYELAGFNCKADLWSLGVTVLEIWLPNMKQHAFHTRDLIDRTEETVRWLRERRDRSGGATEQFEQCMDLARAALVADQEQRTQPSLPPGMIEGRGSMIQLFDRTK